MELRDRDDIEDSDNVWQDIDIESDNVYSDPLFHCMTQKKMERMYLVMMVGTQLVVDEG